MEFHTPKSDVGLPPLAPETSLTRLIGEIPSVQDYISTNKDFDHWKWLGTSLERSRRADYLPTLCYVLAELRRPETKEAHLERFRQLIEPHESEVLVKYKSLPDYFKAEFEMRERLFERDLGAALHYSFGTQPATYGRATLIRQLLGEIGLVKPLERHEYLEAAEWVRKTYELVVTKGVECCLKELLELDREDQKHMQIFRGSIGISAVQITRLHACTGASISTLLGENMDRIKTLILHEMKEGGTYLVGEKIDSQIVAALDS